MNDRSGAQISKRAFFQAFFILLTIIILAGLLTIILPGGSFSRIIKDGREVIEPNSFHTIEKPTYPIWRWFVAPLEVLTSSDAPVILTIIIFILLVGGAFAVLEAGGLLTHALGSLVKKFGGRRYWLLAGITLFFTFLGAFFGLFEEVVPLVPLIMALSYSLGWDALVGLGMSILAVNMGFSAAITNPFTIGVAQKLSGLPLFSGIAFRIPIFIVFYCLLFLFLYRYARRIEKNPETSLLFGEDEILRKKFSHVDFRSGLTSNPSRMKQAGWFFVIVLFLVLVVFIASPFIPVLSDLALPIVGLLFFIAGLGAGLMSGIGAKKVFRALGEGMGGIAPGIPLILMAASIKYITITGGVMDTILNFVATKVQGIGAITAVVLIYLAALLLELFISSAGAKAILLMPLLLPLADITGVTRQMTVSAYCFGDGFSNLAYPTNPVLLIVLGLASVSYGKWLRWTAKLWLAVMTVSILFLILGVALKIGPF